MGDQQDYERRYIDLIERNQARIMRLCRAWTRSPADGEDLRSEILLQLWRSLPSHEGRASEDTWLYRVGLNTAMLFSRRDRARKTRLEVFARRSVATAPPSNPAQYVESQERLSLLTRALGQLRPPDRAVVLLSLEGLSYPEIAEVTGSTVNHVGVRLHRTKQRLARLMNDSKEARDAAT